MVNFMVLTLRKTSPEQAWESRLVTRFQSNYEGYWSGLRWYFVFFLIAILADAASTSYFMIAYNSSPAAEFHPLYRQQIASYGPLIGPFVGAYAKSLAAVIVTVYWRRHAKVIFVLAGLIGLFAAWYNVWGWYNELVAPLVARLLEWSPHLSNG